MIIYETLPDYEFPKAKDVSDLEVVREYVGDPSAGGNYLDLGANDGITGSLTRWLAEAGWHGICIEGSWQAFPKLVQVYRHFPNVRLIHAVVGRETEIRPWYEVPGASSLCTTSIRLAKRGHGREKAIEAEVACVAFDALCGDFYDRIELAVVDLEDSTIEVLRSVLRHFRPRVVCAEYFPRHVFGENEPEEIGNILRSYNYTGLVMTDENIIARKSNDSRDR
jgi:FkbM family methyltransferase